MLYGKRTARKRTAAKKPYRRVPRKSSGARKSIVKIVKSVISRQAEKKVWADYGANLAITSASGITPVFKNLIPVVSQNVTSTGRIGNEIRIRSGYIRGHVNLLPFNSPDNVLPLPCYVKMWVVSARQINTINLASTQIANNFFDAGGTQTGFQGNMLDIDFSINKDAWMLHYSKTVRLGVGYATGTTVATNSYFDNSPMSLPFQFSFGKKLKNLKYDETTNSPTNRNMFLVFQVVPANGATSGGQIMAEYHYTTRVEYEDM